MAKKKETAKKSEGAPLGSTTERMVKVKVLKDFDGHKKGDEISVNERKPLKQGFFKPV